MKKVLLLPLQYALERKAQAICAQKQKKQDAVCNASHETLKYTTEFPYFILKCVIQPPGKYSKKK